MIFIQQTTINRLQMTRVNTQWHNNTEKKQLFSIESCVNFKIDFDDTFLN